MGQALAPFSSDYKQANALGDTFGAPHLYLNISPDLVTTLSGITNLRFPFVQVRKKRSATQRTYPEDEVSLPPWGQRRIKSGIQRASEIARGNREDEAMRGNQISKFPLALEMREIIISIHSVRLPE